MSKPAGRNVERAGCPRKLRVYRLARAGCGHRSGLLKLTVCGYPAAPTGGAGGFLRTGRTVSTTFPAAGFRDSLHTLAGVLGVPAVRRGAAVLRPAEGEQCG